MDQISLTIILRCDSHIIICVKINQFQHDQTELANQKRRCEQAEEMKLKRLTYKFMLDSWWLGELHEVWVWLTLWMLILVAYNFCKDQMNKILSLSATPVQSSFPSVKHLFININLRLSTMMYIYAGHYFHIKCYHFHIIVFSLINKKEFGTRVRWTCCTWKCLGILVVFIDKIFN